ncbi:MAG: GNAT family N-acetyltransferase [Pyrinomonadaceae bacterium]
MNIRIADAGDIRPLIEFNRLMAMETEGKALDTGTLRRGVSSVFEDDRKGFYVVAEEGAAIIAGLMITYEWSDWRNAWFWWIQSVYVIPEHRGRRVYTALYDFVKVLASAKNVCGFRLYVERENRRAQKIYEKVGMTPSHYLMYEEKKESRDPL